MLTVLMGKTASGKDEIARILAMKFAFHRVVRYTTRPLRKNEINGVTYHFITEDEFKQKINEDFFAEYKSYTVDDGSIWFYGTSYESIQRLNLLQNNLIILPPDCYWVFKNNMAVEHKVVYLYANNQTILKRLKKRLDKNDSPKRRLNQDNIDFKGVERIADKIVYNNDGTNVEDVVNKILECVNEDCV